MSTESEDLRAQFGKAAISTGVNIITVDEGGSKVVRLLPPMKSLKETGAWGVYHKQHYGYAVTDPKDATKTRMRPFLCIEEKNENKLTTVSCPECRKVEAMKQKLADDRAMVMKQSMDEGMTREQAEVAAKEATQETADWLQAHNLDQKWFIPVMLEDGNFGILKIPHAGKKAIEKARKALREAEDGRDVFDIDEGAWLKISRTGSGRETEYDCVVVKETKTLEGQRVTVTKPAPLSDDQLRAALNIPDPNTSAIVRRLTPEQIRMLADGGGTPDEVASVLNLGQKEERQETPARTGAAGGTGYQPKPATQAAAPKPAQVNTPKPAPAAAPKPAAAPAAAKPASKPTPAPAPAEEDEETKLLKQLEAVRAKNAAKTQAAAKPAAAPPAEALDPDMSDDEFAARFPPPN